MSTKNIITILLVVSAGIYLTINAKKQNKMIENNYESVDNDPLNARIYTLDNGLKVYLSSYDDAPRVQTNIAVRAGSKNDPAHATGLAHYLEHMLFKGTDKYGTLDYSKEKPLLDKIESLYEEYRSVNMLDVDSRDKIWRQIDSVSGEAAKLCIANEYDKMLSGIGAKGTNAYTSNERTVYVNDVPSNQIEKWLKIEAERFRMPVFRLFHTELEAVYEEKNRSLDSDGSKMFEGLMSGLFEKHQYGTQTTIGTIDHLKNPSLTEIRKYFNKYYVPNNMAICMSGDFEYDNVIRLVNKYFGDFERKDDPLFEVLKEDKIVSPKITNVYGPEAERLYVGFRLNGANSTDANLLRMVDMVLSNTSAGLIDINLNQAQKLAGGGCFPYILNDYSIHGFYGSPLTNQSLEDVKDLLLSQLDEIKEGNFSDWILKAIISDLKLEQIKKYESNNGRAEEFVDAFILNKSWKEHQNSLNELSKITKQDIIDFANKSYSDNYIVVYKRLGDDPNAIKVTKPQITPVTVNREDKSLFLSSVLAEEVSEIEPKFIDFSKDIQKDTINSVSLLYKENKENERFKLNYILDMGTDHNRKLKLALDYLKYLGTDKISSSQKLEEFYKLGCDLSVTTSSNSTKVSLTGLSENFEESVTLLENILSNAVADEDALLSLKATYEKQKNDAKLDKQVILFSAMTSYARYGKNSSFTNSLTKDELDSISSTELLDIIHSLTKNDHRVLYYGPDNISEVKNLMLNVHNTSGLIAIEKKNLNVENKMNKNQVYVLDYDMKQAEVVMYTRGSKLNKDEYSIIKFHNEYFGGGMSSIVFQEMRESKALAYSVYSTYTIPKKLDDSHYGFSYVGTQADKLGDAMQGMLGLLTQMPEANSNMETAREGILQKIRTERITKAKVLDYYEEVKKVNIDYDMRSDLYKNVSAFTMEDLTNFHNTHVKSDNYTYMVLGSSKEIDLKLLESYGDVTILKLEDVFGY
ncbi:insulinase family protein [Flavobacteriales bacterium]|nr:insulinase family protein [Flavobacteriales bacterium]